MAIALWIINVVLTLLFLFAGGTKLAKSRAGLIEAGMGWAENVSAPNIKLLGAAEVLGAIALILPMAVGIAPILAPIAAALLALIAIGATVTHMRRKENFIMPIMIILLSIVSSVIGFMLFA